MFKICLKETIIEFVLNCRELATREFDLTGPWLKGGLKPSYEGEESASL